MLLRLCDVAAGTSDGALAIGPKHDWDLAAGDLMVHEAGGRASAFDGAPFVYNRRHPAQPGLVAANPELHRTMIAAGTR